MSFKTEKGVMKLTKAMMTYNDCYYYKWKAAEDKYNPDYEVVMIIGS
jgi:hypothetical protein